MDGINQTKRTNCDVYGTYWSANKRSSSKVRHVLYFISAFSVAGLKYPTLGLLVVPSSDNSFLRFRRKAFLKSDKAAGLTS
jgi:hypothetical protein